MNIHVICMNDSVQYAIVEDLKKAEQKLKELKLKYFNENKWHFKSFEEYGTRVFWYIRTVEGEE